MNEDFRNNKRIVSNTIFLYTRMIVTTVVALFTVRVVLRTLGVEDYGIYNAVGGLILSMSFVSGILSQAAQRFLAISLGKNDADDLRRNLGVLVVVYMLLSLLVILLGETIGLWFLNFKMVIPADRMFAANITFHLSLASFIATILASPFQALIISHERMKIFAYISILEVVLKLVIVVFLLVDLRLDKLILYATLMLASTFLSNAVYYIYCKRHFPEANGRFVCDSRRMKAILAYSSWTMFGTLSGVCSNHGVGIMLNLFWGPVANAAYAIATQVSNHANMLSQNFFVAVRPSLIKSYARDDAYYTSTLFYTSSKMIFILLFVVLLPVYVETDALLTLWLGETQPYMVDFVRQMLIFILVLTIGYPITAIVQAAGAVKKYHVTVDGFTLLSLPLTYVVIKLGGSAVSVFYTVNIVFIAAHFIRIAILKSVAPYLSMKRYFFYLILPMLCTSFFSVAITLGLKRMLGEGVLSMIAVVVVAVTASLTFSYLMMLTGEERLQIRKMVKKRIH